jgi:Bacterial PH domain
VFYCKSQTTAVFLQKNQQFINNLMGLLNALMGNSSEVSTESVANEFAPILIEGETIVKSFKLIRDMFVFTNKRLILVDKQGLTGSKVDFMTIPYKSINYFSKRSASILDLDAEILIWIKGSETPIQKDFRKGENINDVYKTLSAFVLA